MKTDTLILTTAGCLAAFFVGCQNAPEKISTIAGRKYMNNVINMSEYDNYSVSHEFRNDGVDLVIHRATLGSTYIDKKYARRTKEIAASGLELGAYHFAKSEGFKSDSNGRSLFINDPIEQARHFVKTVKARQVPGQKRILLIFDLECYGKGEKQHISLRSACLAIEEIKRLTGVYPGLYTGSYFISERMGASKVLAKLSDDQNATSIKETLGKCWLWIARYEKHPETLPAHAPWGNWTMWQYTTNAKELAGMGVRPSPEFRHVIAGVTGEFNYFALSSQSFKSWYDKHSWDYQLRHTL